MNKFTSTMKIIEFNLNDASSIIMEKMIEFHDTMLLILFMISLGILYVMIYLMTNKLINRNFLHGESIEIIWTILPMIILIFTAIPSLKTLYMSDELINPDLTIKSIGHQWYWSYEYSDFNNIQFDSYMINEGSNNMFRLLDVDNRTILPYNFSSRMLISSTDVIHSWTIPSMGVKIDAVPGRINQINLFPNRPGLFFGQCSEICGINHSFMPISLEITNLKNFLNWIKNMN